MMSIEPLDRFVARARALEELYPPGAIAADWCGGGDSGDLSAEEAGALGLTAAPARRFEFAVGRRCARCALEALGAGACSVPRSADRSPVWPDGVVGSITHTDGYCAAVVAHRARFAGIGVDTETIDAVRPHLWMRIMGPGERDWFAALPESERPVAAAVLFSAKEAFYKCQYPLLRRRFDLHDVEVLPTPWRPGGGELVFRLNSSLAADPLPAIVGRYRRHGGYVSAGVAMPAR